ncbi:hypothetical protein NECAME_16350 [Necator americanus]|uniref:Uncharacterized protein n=1 Tax=Necator americanus TaxID=51031 RepID=W2TWG7_NECAM|nr:hypothetical protein NECAME_16350 [Necator americanus]ETN86415.1 hypothetical protein NECAME_16350 [Necator americanus]
MLIKRAQMLLKPASTYCKNYDTLVDSDDKKQADVYNVKYADLFKLLGEQTGIKNFSYVNVNKIYDVNRELIHNMTERQPAWVFQKWPEYNGSGTMDIITELRRILLALGKFSKCCATRVQIQQRDPASAEAVV